PLTELGVNPTIRLQFNRPLAPDSSSLDFAFAEVVPPGTMMGATVEADVQLHGALLIIRPKTQLRHGQEYSFGGAEFRDANGSRYTLMKQTFRTPATLSARIDPATPRLLAGNAPLVLDGRGSQAIGSTVVAHRWRQVSGPPVTFGSSTAPTTSVALAGGSGSGMVTVELEVVNAEGEFATGRLQLGAVADPTQPHVWMTGGASPRLLTDADGVIASALRTSPANGVTVAASSPGSMTLIQLWTGSRPVAVGAYEDAIAGPGLPGTDQNGIQITGCAFLGGRFDILEIETDAQGALVRFAADVEQQCSSIGGAQTIMTAVRINSAAPVLR
ncbi:MAG TPA: hypothetical protein VM491_23345, partial [Burkholderiaceae bacterium]|nr:hypothetical protein [Burkholderiaceae bacterium]